MKAWKRPELPALTPSPGRPRVYDTAAQGVVEVGPLDAAAPARMYVCGITPYDATHLGHANTYVAFDLLHRVFLDCGRTVVYTQNVTDVDDPLLERALATGADWVALAEEQTELFRTDMVALNVIPPAHYVGAVEAIPLIVPFIERLIEAGYVYPVDDAEYPDLYFESSRAPGYGEESHLDRETALAIFGERGGDPDRPGKRDPFDCLVWRLARPGEPSWESSLGAGRPGWHIECTAIALDRLGPRFDVQGGGSDLIFPHHEMCAAEGAAATGEPFADAFVHSGMVGYDGEKMSKSKGNLVLVSRLRAAGEDPMAIRLALLAHHYRSDWEYTDADLAAGHDRLALWRDAAALSSALPVDEAVEAIRAALRDDLDAPAALAAADAWAAASLAIDGDEADAPAQFAAAVDALLGVRL